MAQLTPGWQPSAEEERRALLLEAGFENLNRSLPGVRGHDTALDHVHWGSDSRRYCSSDGRGTQVDGKAILHSQVVDKEGLEDVVRDELGRVHDDSAEQS